MDPDLVVLSLNVPKPVEDTIESAGIFQTIMIVDGS